MDQSDKRNATRKRVLKGGTIVFNARSSTLSCTVRDISDTGARLKVSKDLAIPSQFDLIVESDGIEVPCTVAWRRGEEVGVRFDAPPSKRAPKRSQVVQPLDRPGSLSSIRRKT
jgi:hypothetical protein